MYKTLKYYNKNGVMCYGFGDLDRSIFPLTVSDYGEELHCSNLKDIIEKYENKLFDISDNKKKAIITFGTIIRKAIMIVEREHTFYVLVIITNGKLDDVDDTINAIKAAEKYTLSIVCIGIGANVDNSWDRLKTIDSNSFHFINYNYQNEIEFAKNALIKVS